MTVGVGDGLLIVTVGDLLCDIHQGLDRTSGLFHHLSGQPEDHQQSEEDNHCHDDAQLQVACQDLALRTYHCQCPLGARHRGIAHMTVLVVYCHMHCTLFLTVHLVS